MKLLRRKPRVFDIQVQDMVLHVTAGTDLNEESRAAALSFWEQLHAYTLRNPGIRTSKRPLEVPEDAPQIVREMIGAAASAGVGPMFSFQGAVTDHVGRFLARDLADVTVSCGGDFFILARKRQKLTIHTRPDGGGIAVVVQPSKRGVGVATSLGRSAGAVDGLAVLAESCMLADAAAAGVRAIVPKPDGFHLALTYLRKVPGVRGGVLVDGDRIGLAGGVEIAA
ncbi:MAG TPA: hypothetical protein VFT27_02320 [Actinomycetota bacterium]|nr:hypothetical protein [Actinomycetota bacterium]